MPLDPDLPDDKELPPATPARITRSTRANGDGTVTVTITSYDSLGRIISETSETITPKEPPIVKIDPIEIDEKKDGKKIIAAVDTSKLGRFESPQFVLARTADKQTEIT